VYPTEFLDRILFATRYTRHLDKNGYLRFQNWKLYGERGLAKTKVSIWIYEDSLKVEHQAVTLSKYSVQVQDDHKHVQAVSHPHLTETPFRSPQLALFDLGPGEWLLYWKTPDRVPGPRKRRITGILQLPLLEITPLDMAVGTNTESVKLHPQTRLRLMRELQTGQELEE
jgi:hypothetical protein